jgi:V8-like Glu-specific endopeptidase
MGLIMLRWTATCLAAAAALTALARSETATRLAATPAAELATWLDTAALALQGTTDRRRALIANIERVSDFRDDEPIRQVAHAVGLLWITVTPATGEAVTYQCTGTVIAPATLLTAQHCVAKKSATDKIHMELWTDHLATSATSYDVEDEPLEQNAKLDMALLRIKPSARSKLPDSMPRLALRNALPGERLFIVHHSGSAPLQITRAHCRVASEGPTSESELIHTCATRSGSSGAVVLAERDNAVVGLHFASRRHNDVAPGVARSAAAMLAGSPILRDLTASRVAARP